MVGIAIRNSWYSELIYCGGVILEVMQFHVANIWKLFYLLRSRMLFSQCFRKGVPGPFQSTQGSLCLVDD